MTQEFIAADATSARGPRTAISPLLDHVLESGEFLSSLSRIKRPHRAPSKGFAT
jgi:hypothetical protein